MSKKSFGFKMRLGFDNIESLIDLCDLTSKKIKEALAFRRITTEYKLTNIEIISSNDFGYSIMFNFDNEPSIEDILDKAIIEEQTNER